LRTAESIFESISGHSVPGNILSVLKKSSSHLIYSLWRTLRFMCSKTTCSSGVISINTTTTFEQYWGETVKICNLKAVEKHCEGMTPEERELFDKS